MPHKVLFISQGGQSIGYGTNTACKLCDRTFGQESHSWTGGIGFNRTFRGFFASSSPLPPSSSTSFAAPFFARIKGGFYGEVIGWLDSRDSLYSSAKKATDQRPDLRGFASFSAKEDPWLNPTLGAAFVSSLPLATTATLRRSWRKCIGRWFPGRPWTPPLTQMTPTT